MVNKPHAPRQGGKNSNKQSVATVNGEDSSFIVFSNEDKPSKKTKGKNGNPNNASVASNVKGKTPSADAQAPSETTQKPDTRTLIAGSSWTGKLPMTLFNEHCQKQRWEKPEYTIQKREGGFTGGVIIKQKNTKTGDVTTLPPILPPQQYVRERGLKDSTAEARHFAAAYALFRVSNMKNVHMMLPPQYRDLWKGDFGELKSEAASQGEGWLYEADPFAAKRAQEDARKAREKARVDREKRKEEDKKMQVTSLDGQVQSRHVLKGWTRAPKVEMGTQTRRSVESIIRREGVWNAHGIQMTSEHAAKVCTDLEEIGFRRSHVEEATEVCQDREECLEWLLVHVPEDDLPQWTLPENYMAGVSLASGDLKREGRVKRLAAGGYSLDVCAEVLDAHEGDEAKAAEALQLRLLDENDCHGQGSGTGLDVWDEELTALEATFGDRFTNHERICTVTLELLTPSQQSIVVRARPPALDYPNRLPIISVEAALPAYIRLSALKRCLLVAKSQFCGEQMLYNIVDWLEREIPGVMKKPGRLRDIASAASACAEISRPRDAGGKTSSKRPPPRPISWTPNTPGSQRILAAFEARQGRAEQQKMLQMRQKLPAWSLRDSIVHAVANHPVTIVSGETGSGKSTQSVQFVLDDLVQRGFGEQANIICTQPRRISALGLADRVADERCVRVGEEVGFAIRGESKQRSGTTKITFVTTGVLLRRLQTAGGGADDVVKSLADVSHVVIDEVHERSLDTDFLLVLMRDVLRKRTDLRLVLMSATLDAVGFEEYFGAAGLGVGKVEIEGRAHPVRDIYLDEIVRLTGFGGGEVEEDDDAVADHDPRNGPPSTGVPTAVRAVGARINYDLIAQTVQHIDGRLGASDGGILIFLPGTAEIDQTLRALRPLRGLWALPLHASLQSSEQRLVFRPPPTGLRKVVVATNVAETSITIDDIVAVIDTGRVKETHFDPAHAMVKLLEVFASRAACKQRRGRAGRVRPGDCYKLFSRAQEARMSARPEPEIRRVPLEQLCLSVKAMGIADVRAFLASAPSAPDSPAVDGALALLTQMGALQPGPDGAEGADRLTPLGRHMSTIPADLRCAKLLVYGAALGCVDACLSLAAILTARSPFVRAAPLRDAVHAARAAFAPGHGDLLCDLAAYDAWAGQRAAAAPPALRRWCDAHLLHPPTLHDIATHRSHYAASLQDIGLLPSHPSTTSSSHTLLSALLAAAFQPQLARLEFPAPTFAASAAGAVPRDPEARAVKLLTRGQGRVFVHPSSTLFAAPPAAGSAVVVSYWALVATSKPFVRELTPCNVFGLMLLGGGVEIDGRGRGLVVDGWVRVRGWARIGALVARVRGLVDAGLARKVEEPGWAMEGSEVAGVVRRLIEWDGLDR